eukprot:Nk52_evm13s628 gene=Nk52_evmTU13s628
MKLLFGSPLSSLYTRTRLPSLLSSYSRGNSNSSSSRFFMKQPLLASSSFSSRTHSSSSSSSVSSSASVSVDYDPDFSNVTDNIFSKVEQRLLHKENHPLNIIKTKIHKYFCEEYPKISKGRFPASINSNSGEGKVDQLAFKLFDDLHPSVSLDQNFDSLLTPKDHVTRSKNDTYYLSPERVLRTHTSAHQRDLIAQDHQAFLVAGDVYRRDEIDKSHYPVFHQMEGVRMFKVGELLGPDEPVLERVDGASQEEESEHRQNEHTEAAVRAAEEDLKAALEGLAQYLFGDVEKRWVSTYFPFTHPSWELEIFFDGDWLEVLGCGVTRQGVVTSAGKEDRMGWAFGLGLERLAMVLYQIPDIRLFWSKDSRFLNQFDMARDVKAMIGDGSQRTTFQPFSKHPPCLKDITFWVDDNFSSNSFFDLVRSEAGDLVETVKLIDEFKHPKTGKTSHCYRIAYRCLERTLTNDEINELQLAIRNKVEKALQVELR